MERKIKLFAIAFLFSFRIFSQDMPLGGIPVNVDAKIVNAISDSLRKTNIDTIFVYLTVENNSNCTYLIWVKNGDSKIVQISDNSISQPIVVKLSFFKKTNFKQLAITEKEKKLKMIPPLSHRNDGDIFIFDTKKTKYLIESGNSSEFVLDKTKEVSRNQFMIQLKKDLNVASLNWVIQRKYDRFFQ